MSREQVFILLLSLTVAAAAGWLVQVLGRAVDPEGKALRRRLRGGAAAGGAAAGARGAVNLLVTPERRPKVLSGTRVGAAMVKRLRCAFPDTPPGRVVAVVAVACGGVFLSAWVGSRSAVTAGLSAGIVLLGANAVVGYRRGKREKEIGEQLPDALDFLGRVLRAGHSLATGLLMASEELPEPLGPEMRRCYERHSVGVPIDEALREMAQRVGMPEFTFIVTAVSIQRQAGGDLAEVLGNISGTIRARIRLRQHVRAVTAEGRLVGNILLVLPGLFFVISYAMNPKYAGVLLTTHQGLWVIRASLAMQVLGWLGIRKVVAVKL